MEIDKEFEEFVKRQSSAKAEEPPFDPEKELAEWRAHLAELYKTIESSVRAYLAAGQMEMAYRDVELREDFSGPYVVQEMVLRIGRQEVTLTPIGTMLIGSKGRVDVRGPAGNSRLVLVNKKATSARSLVQVKVHAPEASMPPGAKTPPEPIEWEWKIVSAPPAMGFTPLTRDVVLRMILEVANA